MDRALTLAELSEREGEIPVGAVLVREGEIIGSGRNRCIALNDPTAHAEVLAIREAGRKTGNYRLRDTTLYTTLEPCIMCAGAILMARIDEIVFAARDDKAGAAGSIVNLLETPMLNHRCKVQAGVESGRSVEILQRFFEHKRKQRSG